MALGGVMISGGSAGRAYLPITSRFSSAAYTPQPSPTNSPSKTPMTTGTSELHEGQTHFDVELWQIQSE